MKVEIKIPSPGESITEVVIAQWMVANGDQVEIDQEIAEIESDKATLTLSATANGSIQLLAQAGDTIKVGAVACTVDTNAAGNTKSEEKPSNETVVNVTTPEPKPAQQSPKPTESSTANVKISPLAQQMMVQNKLNIDDVLQGLTRIGRQEIEAVLGLPAQDNITISAPKTSEPKAERTQNRQKMTSLRKKLSERLVSVKNETAMLTTFNEIDMSAVMAIREKYQKRFVEKYGFKLGFMSFFTKATCEALKLHPMVNSLIEGDEILSPNYTDIGIAVQTPKGLMVPVLRDAQQMSLAQIEAKIKELAEKARDRKITIEELNGGTFTITNGGTFGSLFSTPIINPPQSAILGMHNVVERPMAVNGAVVIRPMMYVALSYNHRIIDGKDSVGFLVKLKEMIENPQKLLFSGKTAEEKLLDI